MTDETEHPEARKSSAGRLPEAEPSSAPVSAALNATARLAGRVRRKLGDEGSRITQKAAEQTAARVAAGLKPVRELGRSIESRRIAAENAVRGAVAGAAAKAKRAALGVGVYGAITAGAAGEAAVVLLVTHPLDILETGAKFLQARREIAEALARYDQAAAEAAQAERERLALEAVERLTAWDHRTTRHHRSPYLHVSVGPGKAEAWGILLRGPHAGRSLASLAPEILAELCAQVPDQETAAALETWQQVVSRAAAQASKGNSPEGR